MSKLSKKQLLTEGVKFTISAGKIEFWLERRQSVPDQVYFVINYKDMGGWLHSATCNVGNHRITIYPRFGDVTTSRTIPYSEINTQITFGPGK